jgi:hypothetical protein
MTNLCIALEGDSGQREKNFTFGSAAEAQGRESATRITRVWSYVKR